MTVTIIDLSPASIKSSLRSLANDRKPHIPEYLLAEAILRYGSPALPSTSHVLPRSQTKAAACA